MTEHHDAPTLDDTRLFASHLTFNQEAEAERLAALILGSASRMQVLHGKVGVGKTTLVRDHLLNRLAEASDREVFFAVCKPEFPQIVITLDEEEVDIQEAMRRPAIIVLDAFDRFLAQSDADKSWAERNVFDRLHREDVQAAIVVVVSDDALSKVFEFRGYEPRIVEAIFGLQEVDVEKGLATFVEADKHADFSLSPALISELRNELEEKGEGVSPELLIALYHQLRELHLESGAQILSREDYQRLGSLTGILRSYLVARLDRLEKTDGAESREIAAEILREIVGADTEGRYVDLSEVQRRLDIEEDECLEAASKLAAEGGVLREVAPGQFSIAPSQLAHGIREHLEELSAELERPRRIIRESYRSWVRLGILIPEDRYRDVDPYRKRMQMDEEEVQLLFRCSLVYDTSPNLSNADYWRRRLERREDAMDILLEHLYHRFEDVRVTAATLLDDYDVPEVADQLHLVALQDENPRVRAAAVDSLEGSQTDELRELLLMEAQDSRSPHRTAAIQALRIFRDETTARALQALVNDPDAEVDLRKEAILVLAALGVTQAVDALVEIGLEDEDEDDRKNAAAALATLDSPDLNRHLLNDLRRPSGAGSGRWKAYLSGGLRGFGMVVAATVLTFFALLIHGLLLTTTRKWKLGVAYLVVEATAIVVFLVLPVVGAFLLLISLIGSLAASGSVLLTGVRDGSFKSGSLQHMLAGTALVPLALVTFFLGHGLAHALVKKWLRALYIFAVGWAGLATLVLLGDEYVPQLFSPSRTLAELDPSTWPWVITLYDGIGWILFLGSFFYDFGAVIWRWLLFPHRARMRRRRKALLASVVTNPAVTDLLLEAASSGERSVAGWSRRTLTRFAAVLPSANLIERLSKGDAATLPWVIRCLKKVDSDVAVGALARSYEDAGPVLRDRIVRVLAGKPSETSLAALEQLRGRLTWPGRFRYHLGLWQFRFKHLPTTGIVLFLIAAPLAGVFAFEGVQAYNHPERAMLRWAARPLPMGTGAISSADRIVDVLNHRSMLVEAASKIFPAESAKGLLNALEASRGMSPSAYLWGEEDLKKLREAVTRHRIQLIRALERAATHPTTIAYDQAFGLDPDTGLQSSVGLEIANGLEGLLREPEHEESLGEELRVALIRIYSARGKHVELGTVVGVGRADDPLAWKEALLSRGERERSELLQALTRLGSPEAIGALAEFALDRGDRRLGQAQLTVGADRALIETQTEAVRLLGSLSRPEASEALQRIEREAPPIVQRAATGQLRRADLDLEELRLHLDNGEFEEVLVEATASLGKGGLQPGQEQELQMLLGLAYYGLGDYEDAQTHLRAAGDLVLDTENARLALAESLGAPSLDLLDLGQLEQARALLEEAVEVDDNLGWPQAYLALTLVRMDDLTGALEEARIAIELRPDFWAAYQTIFEVLGNDQADTSHWTAAEAILLPALASEPDNELAINTLAFVYHEGLALQDPVYFEESHKLQERLLELVPPGLEADPGTLADFVESCLTTGRYEDSVGLGRGLLEDHSGSEIVLPIRLIVYAALVLDQEWADAEAALAELENDLSLGMPELTWSFNGTAHYVASQRDLPDALKEPLLDALTGRVETVEEARAMIDRSRSALRDIQAGQTAQREELDPALAPR